MARDGGESVCLDGIAKTVGAARNVCGDVQWAALDANRADPAFVHRAVEMAVANGAATINVSDTLGVSLPDQFAALVAGVVERAGDAIVSVHCHDDLGLATANTLAGLRAGARRAEAAVNGLGPRGGNTSLQEVAAPSPPVRTCSPTAAASMRTRSVLPPRPSPRWSQGPTRVC